MAQAKIDANRGDLFEAFFAAAVAARFVKRAKTKSAKKLPPVTVNDVNAVLTEMMKGGYKKNVNDVGSAVIDTVTVNVSIPRKASAFLQTKSNWAKVSATAIIPTLEIPAATEIILDSATPTSIAHSGCFW